MFWVETVWRDSCLSAGSLVRHKLRRVLVLMNGRGGMEWCVLDSEVAFS